MDEGKLEVKHYWRIARKWWWLPLFAAVGGIVAAFLIVGCQRNWTLLRPRKPKRLGVVEAPSEG